MAGEGVRHVVMFKVGKDKVDAMTSALKKLQEGLSGVTWNSFEIYVDLGLNAEGNNSDIALVIDFPDKENYLTYRDHPEHVSIVRQNANMVTSRSAIQYAPVPKL